MGKHKKKRVMNEQEKVNAGERPDYFKEYSFDYSDEPNVDIRNAAIERQRYVYDKLCEKGLENTAIEKLVDLTLEDIERQHTIKSGIETKAGFILALWGILIATLFDSDNELLKIIKENMAIGVEGGVEFVITHIVVCCLLLTAAISLYYIYQTIRSYTYKKFMFEEKECNFKSAVDDKNITYTVLLDNITNSWIENRKIINNMAKYYDKSVKWVIALAVVLVASFCLLV